MYAIACLALSTALFQATAVPQAQPSAPPKMPAAASAEADIGQRLLGVKRIYVESFGDDTVSKQLQAMIVASLTESKHFIVTENEEKADAVLKGSGLEKTSQELHAYSDSTAVGTAAGSHSGSVGGYVHNGTGSVSGTSSGGFAAHSAAISDSAANTETINDARVAVRLVDRDGDVIWTTTQESKGAKYKGASADVAEKVVKQLLRDLERQQKQQTTTSPDR
jgi:curli biogenesis system outer membrane secretion channel CsgG